MFFAALRCFNVSTPLLLASRLVVCIKSCMQQIKLQTLHVWFGFGCWDSPVTSARLQPLAGADSLLAVQTHCWPGKPFVVNATHILFSFFFYGVSLDTLESEPRAGLPTCRHIALTCSVPTPNTIPPTPTHPRLFAGYGSLPLPAG